MKTKVSFYSGGYKLTGTLFVPEGETPGQQRSGIVICGGFASSRDRGLLPMTHYLCEKGYVLLSLDFRGFGESEGPRCRLIPGEEVEDILSAVTFLQQQPQVNGASIGLIGASFGGALVTYAAGIDERVKCIVSLVGVGNCRKWLRRRRESREWETFLEELAEDRVRRVLTGSSKTVDRNHILIPDPKAESFMAEMRATDPTFCGELSLESAQALLDFEPDEIVHKIAPRPMLFITCEKDTVTPVELAKELYDKAGEPKRFIVIPGAAHFDIFHSVLLEPVMAECLSWFAQYLPV